MSNNFLLLMLKISYYQKTLKTHHFYYSIIYSYYSIHYLMINWFLHCFLTTYTTNIRIYSW